MAGGRIKGITVEIGGDTTGLDKALRGVDKSLSSTQKSLKDVERLLKLDPKNTELLEQKQKYLAEAIAETGDRLKVLKDADKQAKAQLEKGELGRDKYDALQREIIDTEQQLKKLKKTANDTGNSLSQSFSKASAGFKSAGDALKPVSAAATGLAAAAFATVPATEELRTDLSRLDQNAREAGLGIEFTRDAFEQFNVISGEVDSSVEATSNLLQAGFTESNLQTAIENLSGAYLRFPDTMKIESLADSLQETLATGQATGQFAELLDRLGISADGFSEQLSTLTSEAERQNFAMETLASAGLADTYNEYLKNNEALVESKQANYELQEAMAGLAEVLTPLVTKITEVATGILNWFTSLSPAAQNIIMIIVAILAVLAPLLTFIGSIAGAISVMLPVLATVGISIGALVGIIAGVIAAIVAIIAVIKNWGAITDWISQRFEQLKAFLSGVWDNIKTKAITTFQNLITGIRSKVSQITSAVQTGFQGAISFITSLPSKAITWGRDFVQGLINGIKSKISGVIDTVAGIANQISAFLHFSRPDKGPLHYYEEWMPDFMDGLSQGIYKNIPKLERAALSVADTLSYGALKGSASKAVDPNAIYNAVRTGASSAKGGDVIINEKSFKRALVGMGVAVR